MLKTVIRIVIALQGAAALLIAGQTWMRPYQLADQLGLALIGNLGLSSFRADIGSFFALAGLFMLLAAWKADRQFVLPPLTLLALALAARLATAAQTGFLTEYTQPIAVEAVTTAFLLLAYAIFRKN